MGDPVLLIHVYKARMVITTLIFIQIMVGKDNHDISSGHQPGSRPVQTDIAAIFFTFDGVGMEAGAIVNVEDVHLLVGLNGCGIHEFLVDGDAAFIGDITISYAGTVDFAL
jgi:hypothetical protein